MKLRSAGSSNARQGQRIAPPDFKVLAGVGPALDEPARRLRDDRPAPDRKHLRRRRLYSRPAAGAEQEGDFIFWLLPPPFADSAAGSPKRGFQTYWGRFHGSQLSDPPPDHLSWVDPVGDQVSYSMCQRVCFTGPGTER